MSKRTQLLHKLKHVYSHNTKLINSKKGVI